MYKFSWNLPLRIPLGRSLKVPSNFHCLRLGRSSPSSHSQIRQYTSRTLSRRFRIINLMCIDYSLRPRLSSRLTLGGRTFPRKPYPYGGMDFDHTFRYSCLDSHFQKLHALFQSRFNVVGTLSYQLLLIPQIRCSTLVPIIFGANSLDG